MIKYLSGAKPSAIKGTALVRLDFNTQDDWRMSAVIPTIKFLLRHSLKVVIISHRGRPQGVKFDRGMPYGFQRDLSLRKDARQLSSLLKGKKVHFLEHFRFEEIKKEIDAAPKGAIILLENLRFLDGEEKNDPAFAKQLAGLADFYVNDAFAVSHRANASVARITQFLPSYAGLEMEREIKFLSKASVDPKHPVVLVIGGAKASDKLGVISHFKKKADWFLLGGGSANTLLSLQGIDVKRSVKDTDPNDLTALKDLLRIKSIVLPEDFVWQNNMILDLGPKTIARYTKKIAAARTIIWSGPLGLFEKSRFAKASIAVANAVAKNKRAFSITGGGETVMFLKKYHLDKKFSFISTGGGALLDFLAGKKLPGIEALK